MTSSRKESSQGAFAQPRDQAEIIDLVQLPSGTRPTPIAYLDLDEVDRCRAMDCGFYQACLAFAARVRWKSFHCRQCPKHPNRPLSKEPVLENSEGAAIIKLR